MFLCLCFGVLEGAIAAGVVFVLGLFGWKGARKVKHKAGCGKATGVAEYDKPVFNIARRSGDCDDCGAIRPLITKGDHHGGEKTVCEDRRACHRREPNG